MPFEIPDSWYMVPVSDLFLLNPKSELNDNMEVGFIPMVFVEDGFSGNHFYKERIWKDVKRGYCHFQNGDIGIAKISPCFENRKSTIFKNLPNTYGAGTTELVILRPIKVFTKFYLYLFKSDWYVKEGTKYFKGVVGQQRVHKEIFTDLHIPLPPLAEQQRIVTEIEHWFSVIDQVEQDKSDLRTIIKQAKSKILDLAVHGKLVPQDPNDESASELLKRINPKAEITCDNGHYPLGWCKTQLKYIADYVNGRAFNPEEWETNGLPIVRIQNLNDETAPYNKSCKSYEEKYLIHKGDLLFAWAASLGTYVWEKGDAWLNQHIFKVIPFVFMDKLYLYYSLESLIKDFYKESHGSGMVHITKKKFEDIECFVPPLAEQQRIVAKIEELFSILDSIQKSLEA